MKITYIIVRTLLGLILLVSSVSYFYLVAVHHMPAQPGEARAYLNGINMVNLMDLTKGIELVCGILFLFERLNALTAVLFFLSWSISYYSTCTSPRQEFRCPLPCYWLTYL